MSLRHLSGLCQNIFPFTKECCSVTGIHAEGELCIEIATTKFFAESMAAFTVLVAASALRGRKIEP